jgi:hypothetical protein
MWDIYLFIPQIGSQIDTEVPHVAWEIDPFGTNFTLDIFYKKISPLIPQELPT